MKTFINRVAGISASVVLLSGLAAASEDFDPATAFGNQCYALVSDYAGGMKSIDASKNMSADQRVVAVATEFKQVISASDQARGCYAKMMKAENSASNSDDLKVGAFKAGVIFEKAQAQFAGLIDEVSVDLLADVAPAAGAGAEADLAAEAQMEAGMDMLISSYKLLDDAEMLGQKITRLGNNG